MKKVFLSLLVVATAFTACNKDSGMEDNTQLITPLVSNITIGDDSDLLDALDYSEPVSSSVSGRSVSYSDDWAFLYTRTSKRGYEQRYYGSTAKYTRSNGNMRRSGLVILTFENGVLRRYSMRYKEDKKIRRVVKRNESLFTTFTNGITNTDTSVKGVIEKGVNTFFGLLVADSTPLVFELDDYDLSATSLSLTTTPANRRVGNSAPPFNIGDRDWITEYGFTRNSEYMVNGVSSLQYVLGDINVSFFYYNGYRVVVEANGFYQEWAFSDLDLAVAVAISHITTDEDLLEAAGFENGNIFNSQLERYFRSTNSNEIVFFEILKDGSGYIVRYNGGGAGETYTDINVAISAAVRLVTHVGENLLSVERDSLHIAGFRLEVQDDSSTNIASLRYFLVNRNVNPTNTISIYIRRDGSDITLNHEQGNQVSYDSIGDAINGANELLAITRVQEDVLAQRYSQLSKTIVDDVVYYENDVARLIIYGDGMTLTESNTDHVFLRSTHGGQNGVWIAIVAELTRIF